MIGSEIGGNVSSGGSVNSGGREIGGSETGGRRQLRPRRDLAGHGHRPGCRQRRGRRPADRAGDRRRARPHRRSSRRSRPNWCPAPVLPPVPPGVPSESSERGPRWSGAASSAGLGRSIPRCDTTDATRRWMASGSSPATARPLETTKVATIAATRYRSCGRRVVDRHDDRVAPVVVFATDPSGVHAQRTSSALGAGAGTFA